MEPQVLIWQEKSAILFLFKFHSCYCFLVTYLVVCKRWFLPLNDSVFICINMKIKVLPLKTQVKAATFSQGNISDDKCILLNTPLLWQLYGLFWVLFITNCTYILAFHLSGSSYKFRYKFSRKFKSVEKYASSLTEIQGKWKISAVLNCTEAKYYFLI